MGRWITRKIYCYLLLLKDKIWVVLKQERGTTVETEEVPEAVPLPVCEIVISSWKVNFLLFLTLVEKTFLPLHFELHVCKSKISLSHQKNNNTTQPKQQQQPPPCCEFDKRWKNNNRFCNFSMYINSSKQTLAKDHLCSLLHLHFKIPLIMEIKHIWMLPYQIAHMSWMGLHRPACGASLQSHSHVCIAVCTYTCAMTIASVFLSGPWLMKHRFASNMLD